MAKNNIGLNTVHHDIKSIFYLGMSRVELCLGRVENRELRMTQIESELIKLSEADSGYTVHHPIFMPDFFKHDYLESFFLDSDEQKRESSFMLLEENLKKIRSTIDENPKRKPPEYVVIHFPGVYPNAYAEKSEFKDILTGSLSRISEIADRYAILLALEYFGSNCMFCDPLEWVEETGKFPGLSILTDTGHLYFASLMRDFDFMSAYELLLSKSCGVHLWTTMRSGFLPDKDDEVVKEFAKVRPHYEIVGQKDVYGANEFYRKYHHVGISLDQKKADGWAFDSLELLKMTLDRGVPVILEATPYYGGTQYYIESMSEIIKFANEYGCT